MSQDGQRLDPARYSVVPRTLSFLVREQQILLQKLGEGGAGWAGLYNGLGGHIERGEDPVSAAVREVREESGLHVPVQRLCGVVMVDTGGSPGIALYVFVGQVASDQPDPDRPELRWIPLDKLEQQPLVEDLPTLIPAALKAYQEHAAFSAAYRYAADGELQISFA